MLTHKSEVENEIREVLEMACETSPVAKANLKCQFPHHEKLVNNLKICAKLVVRKYMLLVRVNNCHITVKLPDSLEGTLCTRCPREVGGLGKRGEGSV